MKAQRKIIAFLDFGIFPGYCMLSSGFTFDEINKHLKRQKANEWIAGMSLDRDFFGTCNFMAMKRVIEKKGEEEKHLYYINLRDGFDFSDYDMSKLAHEVLHICQYYLPDVLNRNKEQEAEAYFHTHLMRQALKELRPKKKSK